MSGSITNCHIIGQKNGYPLNMQDIKTIQEPKTADFSQFYPIDTGKIYGLVAVDFPSKISWNSPKSCSSQKSEAS